MSNSRKERTRRLCYAILDGKACDNDCHEYNLIPSDLDELYSLGENIVDKALTKPEVRPSTTEAKRKEVDSWIEYYFS